MNTIGWGTVTNDTKDGAEIKLNDKTYFITNEDKLGYTDFGKDYLVYTWQDEHTGKLMASEKIDKYLENKVPTEKYRKNQKLTGVIYRETPLGFNVFFDKKYSGLVFKQEIFDDYPTGEKLPVYIKDIRPDGKVNLSLRPIGYRFSINKLQSAILSKLKENNGTLMLSDKSSPEEIKKLFGMSKNNFKKAIGGLYKNKIIKILDDKIILLN